MERKKKFWLLLISILVFSALSIHPVGAVDELYLTGILQNADVQSGLAVVNVKSENCHGMRSFRVDDISRLADATDNTISFTINSSTCKIGEIYTMHLVTVSKGGQR